MGVCVCVIMLPLILFCCHLRYQGDTSQVMKKLKEEMVREAVKTEFLLSTHTFRSTGPEEKELEGLY